MITRRRFVMLAGAGLSGYVLGVRAQRPRHVFAYVGSWTQGPFGVGGGGGITVFALNADDGVLTQLAHTGPELDNMNAGYLCLSRDARFLYATNEVKNRNGEFGAGGEIMTFALDPADSSLRLIGTQPSMGVNPAYVTIDATGSMIATANHGSYEPAVRVTTRNGAPEIEKFYDDGTVAILPVRPDGTLGPASHVEVLERLSGVDPVSQRSPHAHSVNFDPSNRFVIVCDKGADRIYTFRADLQARALTNRKSFATAAGIAPRHSAFHPTLPYVFVLHERESSLAAYRYDATSGDIELLDTVATIPAGFSRRNSPADVRVHPNGRFVYGSNRGHDSIAIFAIDASTGRLTSVAIEPTGGATPRAINFEPTGRFLYAANQGANNITSFGVDAATGALTATGASVDVLKPACIQFLTV